MGVQATVGVFVAVAVCVVVWVGVLLGVLVGVAVSVATSVGVQVAVGVCVDVNVGVAVEVEVGMTCTAVGVRVGAKATRRVCRAHLPARQLAAAQTNIRPSAATSKRCCAPLSLDGACTTINERNSSSAAASWLASPPYLSSTLP